MNLRNLSIPQLKQRLVSLEREWDRLDSQPKFSERQEQVSRDIQETEDAILWKESVALKLEPETAAKYL